jgi:hypothetical protein
MPTSIKHLEGADSTSSLQTDQPHPHQPSRHGPRLVLRTCLVQPCPLYLSPSCWPLSPCSAARQRAPRRGRARPPPSLRACTPPPTHRSLSHFHSSTPSSALWNTRGEAALHLLSSRGRDRAELVRLQLAMGDVAAPSLSLLSFPISYCSYVRT